MDLKKYIRSIPDYPKKGILFRDITTLIKDKDAFKECIGQMSKMITKLRFDKIESIESRGFVFASALCYNLSKSLILMRKKNKLPAAKYSQDFQLEYGKSTLEIFFDLLSEEKIATVASKDKMKPVADGIALMGNAINTFAKIDMATIVGNNWTPGKETSFESFIGGLAMATEKIKDPAQLQNVAVGIRALGEAMQTFTTIDTEKISLAMSGAGEWKLKGTKQYELEVGTQKLQTGGLITTESAGIFELHQGEMVMDNAAVAAFRKSLDLMNMSQTNALAGVGAAATIIVNNNNNVDNSMRSSQSTSVSVPEATRTNESTLRALQMA